MEAFPLRISHLKWFKLIFWRYEVEAEIFLQKKQTLSLLDFVQIYLKALEKNLDLKFLSSANFA